MADDFTGVPTDRYYELRGFVHNQAVLLFALAIVVWLLVVTLIQKGALAGWGDLVRHVIPGD